MASDKMNHNRANKSNWINLLVLLLIVLLSPLIFVVLLLWLLTRIGLNFLVWILWCTRGKDILFIYSNSPIWHDYIEEHLIPYIKARSVLLNWSNRRHWFGALSLQSVVFRHFGGSKEYNPLAVYFRPFKPHRTFRFFNAFHDYKHGKPETLKRIESDFFSSVGTKVGDAQSPALPTDATPSRHAQP